MFLPIRTSVWPRRTPYANYALIALNVVFFLLTYDQSHRVLVQVQGEPQVMMVGVRNWAITWQLYPHFCWSMPWQFLSYAFLHANIGHILGNMFFLYLFGNSVNDRMGDIRYLLFYCGGAIFSGMGHVVMNMQSFVPTLGASGAVAAVTGAYLVLFPKSVITVLYVFFFIGTMEVRALWFIVVKMVFIDNILARTSGGVAYDAHLAGYLYGVSLLLLILGLGGLPSQHLDLLGMIKQWNRRRVYRDSVRQGGDPFFSYGMEPGRRTVRAREIRTPEQIERQERLQGLRGQINRHVAQHNLPAAVQAYLQWSQLDQEAILPRQTLLDIANQLTSEGRHAQAAQAYERFLRHYPQYEHVEQVMLMAGILYARYLNQPDRAIHLLRKAAPRLTNPNQLRMCRDQLARLEG